MSSCSFLFEQCLGRYKCQSFIFCRIFPIQWKEQDSSSLNEVKKFPKYILAGIKSAILFLFLLSSQKKNEDSNYTGS